MAQNDQQTIAIEDLTTLPLSTEMEEEEAPQQGFITPVQPQEAPAVAPEVEPESPVTLEPEVEPQPVPVPTPQPAAVPETLEVPEPVVDQAPEPVDEFSMVQRDIQAEQAPRPLPALFPTYIEKLGTIKETNPTLLNTAKSRLRVEVADNYTRGVLDDGENLEYRKNLITNSGFVGVPELNEDGSIKLDPVTNEPILLEKYPMPASGIADEEDRYRRNLIFSMEYPANPNGVYLFYDGDSAMPTGGINLKGDIERLATEYQEGFGPLRGIYRIQDERGGNAFYLDVLKSRGVTNPTKQLYYLRQQAKSGTFSGIEATRTKVGMVDMYPALTNLGMMGVEFGVDQTFQGALVTLEVANDLGLTPIDPDDIIPSLKDMYSNGRKLPYFTLSAERFAEKEGISIDEAEVVLGFTDDATTMLKRMTVETAAAAPLIIKSVATLDAATLGGFLQHVSRHYRKLIDDPWEKARESGDVGFKRMWQKRSEELGLDPDVAPSDQMDIVQMTRILDEAGVSFDEAFDSFVQTQRFAPSRAYLEASLERGMLARLQGSTAERTEFFKPRVDALKRRLDDTNEKLRNAQSSLDMNTTRSGRKSTEKRIADLKRIRRGIIGEIDDLIVNDTTPVYMKDFFVQDLGIATPVAAYTYATMYQLTEGREDLSGLTAFGSVLATLNPTTRRAVSYSAEEVKYALKRGLGMEAPSSKAVILARRLKDAPPDLRDQIYAHMENTSKLVQDLGDIRYPPDHPKAGEPILTEDMLYQSFSRMSGLISLRHMENQLANKTIDQKDAGKFGEKLSQIEAMLQQRGLEMDALGQVVQNLKYIEFNDKFNPNDPTHALLPTLRKFYESEKALLDQEAAEFKRIMDDQESITRIFSADATAEDVQEYINGSKSIAHALSVELQRFRKYNITTDMPIVEQERLMQEKLVELQTQVADAFARHEKFVADPDRRLANTDLVRMVRTHEATRYEELRLQFDELKTMYPEDARIDVTDLHEQLILGEYELNDRAINVAIPVLQEGTEASRAIARLNIPNQRLKQLHRLFAGSAGDYMTAIRDRNSETAEIVDEALAAEDLLDADPYQQMLFIRTMFKENGMTDQLPPVGLRVDEYMHLVSALGREAGAKAGRPEVVPVRQLRSDLLERGATEFYSGFYTANPTRVEGLADEYGRVRGNYREYIDVFKRDSRSLKAIIAAEGSYDDLDTTSLRRFVTEFKLGEPRTAADLQGFVRMFENITGKPLDVKTPEGRQVRSILTRLALEQVAQTAGGKVFRELLAGIREGEGGVINPQKVGEIESQIEELRAGRIKEEGVFVNLSNLIGVDSMGNYKLTDVNGEPLVNIRAIEHALSFDNFKRYSEEAKKAEEQFFKDLDIQKDIIRTEFNTASSELQSELKARRIMVDRFGSTEGGIGKALLGIVDTADGMAQIDTLRTDFVAQQVRDGIPKEQAERAFKQVVQQSTIDALFMDVSKPGHRATFEIVNAEGKATETRRLVQIDPEKLLQLLGIRGDTTEATSKERAVRTLLGDEVYNHMRTVGELLYTNEATAEKLNITGIAMPLSAESQLSRVTSFFRGVISLRWLVSEAAIREARRSNYELTKMMLFDPKIGRDVLDMVLDPEFKAQKFMDIYPTLISQIAKNDVLIEGAVDLYQEGLSPVLERQMEALESRDPAEDQNQGFFSSLRRDYDLNLFGE